MIVFLLEVEILQFIKNILVVHISNLTKAHINI